MGSPSLFAAERDPDQRNGQAIAASVSERWGDDARTETRLAEQGDGGSSCCGAVPGCSSGARLAGQDGVSGPEHRTICSQRCEVNGLAYCGMRTPAPRLPACLKSQAAGPYPRQIVQPNPQLRAQTRDQGRAPGMQRGVVDADTTGRSQRNRHSAPTASSPPVLATISTIA